MGYRYRYWYAGRFAKLAALGDCILEVVVSEGEAEIIAPFRRQPPRELAEGLGLSRTRLVTAVSRQAIRKLLDELDALASVTQLVLYTAELRGIKKLASRQQRINYLLDWIKRYGKLYSTYCAVTNQVITMPADVMTVKVPAGGNIIAHASTHRLFLRKERDAWAIEVFNSPTIAMGAKAYFLSN